MHRKHSPRTVAWSRPHRKRSLSIVAWRHRARVNVPNMSIGAQGCCLATNCNICPRRTRLPLLRVGTCSLSRCLAMRHNIYKNVVNIFHILRRFMGCCLRGDGFSLPIPPHKRLEPGKLSRDSDGLCGWRPPFDSRQGQEMYFYSTASRPILGPTYRPIQWVLRSLSLGVKRMRHEADYSPPSSVEVKNGLHSLVVNQLSTETFCL
jgi:hypothetical protein